MTDKKTPTHDGYAPEKDKRGYQPGLPVTIPTGDPKPQNGYIPTGTSDNPTNTPSSPPGDE